MLFRESSPTPLKTTCCQHSQTEMRRLSNCLKSFQMKQWLIWCLWLIVLPLLCFSLTRCQDLSHIPHCTFLFCPSSFSWKPSHPQSINLSDSHPPSRLGCCSSMSLLSWPRPPSLECKALSSSRPWPYFTGEHLEIMSQKTSGVFDA